MIPVNDIIATLPQLGSYINYDSAPMIWLVLRSVNQCSYRKVDYFCQQHIATQANGERR
jgi:hypothetical protein